MFQIKALILNPARCDGSNNLAMLTFPLSDGEVRRAFSSIGTSPKNDDWFILWYSCPCDELCAFLTKDESIEKLQFLALKINELTDSQLEKYLAIVRRRNFDVKNIDDLINLTDNLHCFDFVYDPYSIESGDYGISMERNNNVWISNYCDGGAIPKKYCLNAV